MKNLLLILLFGISLNGQAHRSYPFLDEVIYKFFETYNLTDEKIEKGDKLDFLKKPEGWVIDIVYYNSEKEEMSVKKSMLFWDAESGNYQDLDFEVAGPRREFLNYYSIYHAFLQTNPNDRLNFAIHSYYGYPSAYEDVLKAFSYSKDMNDTALYSLGDAYLNKMFPYNEVTHEKVEYSNDFVSDVSQGLQFKREVFKRNPNFQTVVGSIGIKYANDLVAVVYNSDVYFNHPENSNQYHDNAYPKWMIEYGKNILNHCPENAILFTTGDNDTYPLLYLQQHMHYREDVIVVNQSLIFTTEMIEYLIKKGIKTAIDIDAYKKEENQIIVLEPTTENADIFNLLNGIQNETLKTETYPNTDREFPVGQRAVYLQKGDKKMEWRINRARIFMGELAMLDIIASNFGDRPVCLMPGGSNIGLGNYFKREGLIFNLTWEKEDGENQTDQSKMSKNLLSNLSMEEGASIPPQFKANYYLAFYMLAKDYLDNGDKDQAVRVLMRATDKIPFDSKNLNSLTIYLLDLIVDTEKEDLAKSFFGRIILSGEMNLSMLEKADPSSWNFRIIDDLSSYYQSLLLLRQITENVDYLKNHAQYEKIETYEKRVSNLTFKVISNKPYLKMLLAQKGYLLQLIQDNPALNSQD